MHWRKSGWALGVALLASALCGLWVANQALSDRQLDEGSVGYWLLVPVSLRAMPRIAAIEPPVIDYRAADGAKPSVLRLRYRSRATEADIRAQTGQHLQAMRFRPASQGEFTSADHDVQLWLQRQGDHVQVEVLFFER